MMLSRDGDVPPTMDDALPFCGRRASVVKTGAETEGTTGTPTTQRSPSPGLLAGRLYHSITLPLYHLPRTIGVHLAPRPYAPDDLQWSRRPGSRKGVRSWTRPEGSADG